MLAFVQLAALNPLVVRLGVMSRPQLTNYEARGVTQVRVRLRVRVRMRLRAALDSIVFNLSISLACSAWDMRYGTWHVSDTLNQSV